MRTRSSRCPPRRRTPISDYELPDGTIPVLLSANTSELLRREARAIGAYLADHPEVSPGQVADMLFRTRLARRYRALAMVTTHAELLAALDAISSGAEHPAVVRTNEPAAAHRLAYVFPGQGSQRPGMGRLYYDMSSAFRVEVDRCDVAFHEQFGQSPLDYLLNENTQATDTATVVQPALFMQMAGLAALWRSFGIQPDSTVGHSQGEIAGAYAAGQLSLADAVLVVGTRAHAVDRIAADRYAMAIVAADRDECEELLARRSGWGQVSVINAPRMVGISGERATVQDVIEELDERGRFSAVIGVRYPAHTTMIGELQDDLRDGVRNGLRHQNFHESNISCIGATLGGPISTDLPVDEYWFWNLRNIVRFDKAVAAAVAHKIDTFVELAEHPTLQLSIQENLNTLTGSDAATVVGTTTRDATDLREFTHNLAALAIHDLDYRWDQLRTDSAGPPDPPLLDFPNVQLNERALWLPYNTGNTGSAHPVTTPDTTSHAPAPDTVPAQLLVEEWVRLTRRSLLGPRSIGIVDHTGDCAKLAAALCTAAPDHGTSARLIDAARTEDDNDVDTVLILLPESPEMDTDTAATEITEFFGHRTWWTRLPREMTECWLITVAAETVSAAEEPPHPVHAAAAAGFRCIGTEHPGTAFRHLDLSTESAQPDAAPTILTALHTADEPELALCGNTVYVKRLSAANKPSPLAMPENVLILGGTGGVGMEFCDYLARLDVPRITLVSRSGETATVTEQLRRIRRVSSAEISVVACDVSDARAGARLASHQGDAPVDLVIHAAADYSDIVDVDLAEITPDTVALGLQGKTVGISAVLHALTLADDCRVLLCSSLAASIGGRGKVVYAAANRMLDTLAHRFRAEGLDCISVQWGQWSVYQHQNERDRARLAAVGYLPMDSASAISLGLRGHNDNAIIAALDWDRSRGALDDYGYGPTLSYLTTPTTAEGGQVADVDLPQRMVQLLGEVIGVDDHESIDSAQPLVASGLDSLQALEFRRQVKQRYQHELPVDELIGGASLDDVIALLGGHRAQLSKL